MGKWRREHIVDPLVYRTGKVHWRNYEAGYNVAELEPASRRFTTYVLQEYFVPVGRFDEFVPKMAEILKRHRVNMLNISVRHALKDPGTVMAWAREEVFAFVLYYKQRTRVNARERVAVWTRELVEAAISCGGTYYLPYQPHATFDQVKRAYPRVEELFQLKSRYDPDFRLRNVLWDTYYAPTLETKREEPPMPTSSEFKTVYGKTESADGFYRFLQNVYRLYPEDRFHTLIKEATQRNATDEAIYHDVQAGLPAIKPFLADLFYALPSLKKQKKEMARQALELLKGKCAIDGYVEIGTTGRYFSHLKKHLTIRGPVTLVNDVAPTNSPVDILERGGLGKPFRFVPLNDYAPLPADALPDSSAEVVTCFIGLHHCQPDKLDAFLRSIARVMKPGGTFILRDHHVPTPEMDAFVSLAHSVFNAGLGAPWEVNAKEPRFFAPLGRWIQALDAVGLEDTGARLLQAHDPTDNTLMSFVKTRA
jgi:SAM-dependent methyltransferase